ncbi:MAG: sulfatase-like hydrolase/transferase [Planctomycetota bacterium]
MHRTVIAQRLTLVLAGLTLSACGGDPAAARPNVILITLDTVRADFLSCYGSTNGATPAVDALARDGVLFERAVSSSGLTPASHATILTGDFQYRHGLRVLAAGSGFRLPAEHDTLATAFDAAGYRTGAIHSAFPVSGHFGFAQGFDTFDSFETKVEKTPDGGKVGWDVSTFQRRSDETTDRAVAWLEEAAQDDRPFFLWLHYWDPHDPVKLPDSADIERLRYDPGTGDLKDEQTLTYAVEVRFQDEEIGRLLAAIDAAQLSDSTVVALTSDHGQGLVDGRALHGWAMHRTLYREQVHVPLLLRGPGVPRGVRAADQVRTADLAPTLLDLAGLPEFYEQIDGVSLVERFEGEPLGDLVAYGEQINGYDHNAGMRRKRPEAAFLYMVSDGDWKLVYRPHMPDRSELFHVAVDPVEAKDVASEHPEIVDRLLADLAERNPWVLESFPQAAGPDEGATAALSGLGYAAAEVEGTGTWWWTCPVHPDVREDRRGRHDVDDCGRILVPQGVWTE